MKIKNQNDKFFIAEISPAKINILAYLVFLYLIFDLVINILKNDLHGVIGRFIGVLLVAIYLFTIENKKFIFDLVNKNFTYIERKIFFSNKKSFSFTIIKSFYIQTKSFSSNQEKKLSRIILETDSEKIPLTNAFYPKLYAYLDICKKFNDLLKNSTNTLEYSIKKLLEDGEKISAIKLLSESKGCSLNEAKSLIKDYMS